MISNLKTFENKNFGKLTVIEKDGEFFFIANEVATMLGYVNPRKAIYDHVDEEDKGVTKWNTPGGIQNISIINESGLYSLILSSKLPQAKIFKAWVTRETPTEEKAIEFTDVRAKLAEKSREGHTDEVKP